MLSAAKIENIERERGKMEAANHLCLVNCFTIEMLNDRHLYSVKQTTHSTFFSNMPILRERERKRERKRLNVRVLICICLSVPTNNETMNLVLLQKHVIAEKYNVAIQYGNYFITIKVAG